MEGHPCDDFLIEFGLSEGTIFECHLRDDIGYGGNLVAAAAPAVENEAAQVAKHAPSPERVPQRQPLDIQPLPDIQPLHMSKPLAKFWK